MRDTFKLLAAGVFVLTILSFCGWLKVHNYNECRSKGFGRLYCVTATN